MFSMMYRINRLDRRIGVSGLPIVILLFVLTVISVSCENSEGKGGTGSISGSVIEHFYNDDYSALIYQQPAVDEEVYVLYGNDISLGDREFTSNSGHFRFKYLYPGEYQIYYRSKDSTSILDEASEIMYTVNLEKGEDLEMGELVKLSILDYDDGAAVIKGVVKEIKYDKDYLPNLIEEYRDFAYEHEIYLTYGNHAYYDKRVRTQHDGYFEFSNLIPGEYLIFLYSEDVTRIKDRVVLKFEVTITGFDQVIDLGEITIENI